MFDSVLVIFDILFQFLSLLWFNLREVACLGTCYIFDILFQFHMLVFKYSLDQNREYWELFCRVPKSVGGEDGVKLIDPLYSLL